MKSLPMTMPRVIAFALLLGVAIHIEAADISPSEAKLEPLSHHPGPARGDVLFDLKKPGNAKPWTGAGDGISHTFSVGKPATLRIRANSSATRGSESPQTWMESTLTLNGKAIAGPERREAFISTGVHFDRTYGLEPFKEYTITIEQLNDGCTASGFTLHGEIVDH